VGKKKGDGGRHHFGTAQLPGRNGGGSVRTEKDSGGLSGRPVPVNRWGGPREAARTVARRRKLWELERTGVSSNGSKKRGKKLFFQSCVIVKISAGDWVQKRAVDREWKWPESRKETLRRKRGGTLKREEQSAEGGQGFNSDRF